MLVSTGALAAARALFDRRRRRRIAVVPVLAALVLAPSGLVLALAPSPGEVAVRIADRRLTVSWSAVAGADDYVVAVRPANGIVPFAWEEYDAASSPWTIADMWAMSGTSYEVRVAAVTDGRPAWSPAVTVAAPVLRPAPAGTFEVRAPAPPAVGDVVRSLRPDPFFRMTNRSFRWSLCGANGTDCKLLPVLRRTRDRYYVIGSEMRGKLLRVQVDYDWDGVSWSATADVRIAADAPRRPVAPRSYVPPPSVAEASRACPRRSGAEVDTDGAPADTTTEIETHLHALTVESVRLGTTNDMGDNGGSIAALCDDLLVVTAWGRFVLLSGREARSLDGQVPMASDESGLVRIPELETRYPDFNSRRFRVADVLLRPESTDRWRLFVTHNYADGECFGFRLSATAVRREGERVVVSPAWKTVADLGPCVFTAELSLQAGGRMLSDGPNHLLVATGDFADLPLGNSARQDLDSNSGKLLRVDVETGRTEVLAVGFRNPQGLARDADGVLWETEHGPRGGDELNVLEPGANYGWPLVSHGVRYGARIRDMTEPYGEGRHDGYASPRFFWAPAIAVSSVIVNDARFFPLWGNDLLVGTLGTAAVFRVRRDGTDVKSAERIDVGRAIRDMASMPDGRIALFDGSDHVLFVSRSEKYCNEEFRPDRIWSLLCPPGDAGAPPGAGR